METLMQYRISWLTFVLSALGILGIYLLLRFAGQILQRFHLSRSLQQNLENSLERIRQIYEPIAIILVMSLFFIVRPVLHGPVMLLLFIGAFAHIRNYISGRLIVVGRRLELGDRVRMDALTGRVFKLGNLGMHIQSKEGLHYYNYSRIFAEGYTLIPGDEFGGMYRLDIFPASAERDSGQLGEHLFNLLSSAPYLDHSFKPEVKEIEGKPGHHDTQLLLREESHLRELQLLLREWGYEFEPLSEY